MEHWIWSGDSPAGCNWGLFLGTLWVEVMDAAQPLATHNTGDHSEKWSRTSVLDHFKKGWEVLKYLYH